jgi:hypothetical protein
MYFNDFRTCIIFLKGHRLVNSSLVDRKLRTKSTINFLIEIFV